MKVPVVEARARLTSFCSVLCLVIVMMCAASAAQAQMYTLSGATFTESGGDVVVTYKFGDRLAPGQKTFADLANDTNDHVPFCVCLERHKFLHFKRELGCTPVFLKLDDVTENAAGWYMKNAITSTFAGVGTGGSYTLEITQGACPVPEPSAWAAFAIGGIGLASFAIRRRLA